MVYIFLNSSFPNGVWDYKSREDLQFFIFIKIKLYLYNLTKYKLKILKLKIIYLFFQREIMGFIIIGNVTKFNFFLNFFLEKKSHLVRRALVLPAFLCPQWSILEGLYCFASIFLPNQKIHTIRNDVGQYEIK